MTTWNSAQFDRLILKISNGFQITATPYDDTAEWTHLVSDSVPPAVLYEQIKSRWPILVPNSDTELFALVHCQHGAHSGVWLHYLATPTLRDYFDNGCYEIDFW